MRKQLTSIVFILAQLVLIATPLFAHEAAANSFATGTVFGSAWLDANGNGLYELTESARANVTVEIKIVNGETLQRTQTDADGNYLFTELEYGEYEIWSDGLSGVSTLAGTIHVAEVNGTTSLNIPLMPEADDDRKIVTPSIMKSIFLPFINS